MTAVRTGEGGQPVHVKLGQLSPAQKRKYWEGQRLHHFNQFVSDHISLLRSVPRVQDPECGEVQYGGAAALPSTSVVIVFHNEARSTLLRTVRSVLDRSPQHLLDHVLLVDDFSDMEHLKKPLEDYLSSPGLSKVRVLRSPSRQGLIRARLLGLSHVNTSTVVFLDSHCECFEGWLEPLLSRLAQDPTTVAVPVIDNIDKNTFAINVFPAKHLSVGTFSWSLLFQWMPVQHAERLRRRSPIDPVRSPTMAGGLFAIDRNFFHKLGTYDPGMKTWGGENLELSFKIWMCGGTLETVPCSHVGHVFRTSSPHTSKDFFRHLSANLGRLAKVWLDEYSVYSYTARRVTEQSQRGLVGDVSERQALRRRLRCHSFGWFMKHVMPEVYFPADRIAHGQIENNMTGQCISCRGKSAVVKTCKGQSRYTNQNWYMNPDESSVFQDEQYLLGPRVCLDYSGQRRTPNCLKCHGMGGNQLWKYSEEQKQLYHVRSRKCAKASPPGGDPQEVITMATCDPGDPLQQWHWDTSPTPGPSWRKDDAAGIPVL